MSEDVAGETWYVDCGEEGYFLTTGPDNEKYGMNHSYAPPERLAAILNHLQDEARGREAEPVMEGAWLSVERWPLGDTEERQPMYCLYLRGRGVNGPLDWLRIGDVWEQEGADYLNRLKDEAREAQRLRDLLDILLPDLRVLVAGEPYDHERIHIRRLKEALEGNPTLQVTTRELDAEREAQRLRSEVDAAEKLSLDSFVEMLRLRKALVEIKNTPHVALAGPRLRDIAAAALEASSEGGVA
jgi:hypothetical protein